MAFRGFPCYPFSFCPSGLRFVELSFSLPFLCLAVPFACWSGAMLMPSLGPIDFLLFLGLYVCSDSIRLATPRVVLSFCLFCSGCLRLAYGVLLLFLASAYATLFLCFRCWLVSFSRLYPPGYVPFRLYVPCSGCFSPRRFELRGPAWCVWLFLGLIRVVLLSAPFRALSLTRRFVCLCPAVLLCPVSYPGRSLSELVN